MMRVTTTASRLVSLLVLVATLGRGLAADGGVDDVPDAFDWRSTEDGNLVTPVRNMMGLAGRPCGEAGWVFATTAMVADRLSVLQRNSQVKAQLSNQVLIDCLEGDVCGSANGGRIEDALRYIMDNHGIPDRTCMGFRATKDKCSHLNMCLNCVPVPKVVCEPRPAYFKYPITAYGRVSVEAHALKAEVYTHGPVACEFKDGSFGTVVGFDGASFAVKRELGTAYGDKGFDSATSEELVECWGATAAPPYRFYDPKTEAEALLLGARAPRAFFNDGHNSPLLATLRGSSATAGHRRSELVLTPPPRSLRTHQMPRRFSWLEVSGKAWVTPMQSHHNGPGYCGACYAMASASVFSDRLKIRAGGPNATDMFISPQNTVDCVRGPMTAGCGGGDSRDVFPVWKDVGTVDETCNAWRNEEQPCVAGGVSCRVCTKDGSCATAKDGQFEVYQVSEWGMVSGEENMMNEILARGPIDCGIATPPALSEDYFGSDILCDDDTPRKLWEITHDVSVVGWGEDEKGNKFWVIRNSWGSHWGDGGFAKICRGRKKDGPGGNMLLESSCSWVVPK